MKLDEPPRVRHGNRSAILVTLVGDSAILGPFYLNNVLVTPDII
jgi:hypothetical protein